MTRDQTICQLRDAALSLVMLKGQWGSPFGIRSICTSAGGIEIAFHTAFGTDGATVCASFGLDLWAPNKVLNVEWDEAGHTKTVSFRRGAWEQSLLLAAHQLVGPASP